MAARKVSAAHVASTARGIGGRSARSRSGLPCCAGMVEKTFIDANELLLDSYRLARKIFDDGYRPDYVVGVWRGGCPIGVAVEEFLRVQQCPIKHHTAIKTQSYTGIGQSREVEVFGLEYIVSKVDAEDKVLIIDDVFDSGKTVKAILEAVRSMARRNTPEMRVACVYFKPTANQVGIVPHYWLHETEAWLVFPHELEGLTLEELGQKWDPEIAQIIQAPGGPFARAGEA